MQPPFPCPVSTWHNDTYTAISPDRKELSCEGKTVIVTGAGGVIGREAAVGFAAAGAKHVALVGRSLEPLNGTKKAVVAAGKSVCSVHSADVTDLKAMTAIASELGTWDVFVLNAGYISKSSEIAKADIDDYWQSYETNVKSVLITAQAFLPSANKDRAVLLGVTSGAMVFPTAMTAGLSAYMTSKIALVKTLEYLGLENPNLFVASVHPGMIDSKVFRGSGATPDMVPMDNAKLPAHFMLWLSSKEAEPLKGRLLWANWDVEELTAKAGAIQSNDILTVSMSGWPFTHL